MMNVKKDTRGITLIELVIVMLISLILMGIAGTMLLSSTNNYHQTASTDLAKLSSDEVSSFMREELRYASDMVISKTPLSDPYTKENGWHYFYISASDEGRLYYDQITTPLYPESFYHNHKLAIETRGYDDYHLNLSYYMYDNQQKENYRSTETLELMNLKLQVADGKTWFDGTTYDSHSTAYYIYYVRPTVVIGGEPEKEANTGTVKDQIACNDDGSTPDSKNKGEYRGEKRYYQGDFTYLVDEIDSSKKIWYECVLNVSESAIYRNPKYDDTAWKKITEYYDKTSNYFIGDVVIHPDFKKLDRDMYILYYNMKPWTVTGRYQHFNTNGSVWAPVYPDKYNSPICEVAWDEMNTNTYENIKYTYVYGSPYTKLYSYNFFLNRPSDASKIKEYSSTKSYEPFAEFKLLNPSDYIVKFKNDYYINVTGTMLTGVEPESVVNSKYVWQKLQTTWSPKSAYRKDDIVISQATNNRYNVFRAKKDVDRATDDVSIDYKDGSVNEFWEPVYWDATAEQWKVTQIGS